MSNMGRGSFQGAARAGKEGEWSGGGGQGEADKGIKACVLQASHHRKCGNKYIS